MLEKSASCHLKKMHFSAFLGIEVDDALEITEMTEA